MKQGIGYSLMKDHSEQ